MGPSSHITRRGQQPHVQSPACERVCTCRDLCCPATHAQNGPPSAFENSAIAVPKTKLMMAVSFMTMFNAGPEVSFSGSPTVSPVTEFLCASEPFTNSLPRPPAEMYFLELSQAPRVL